MVRRCLWASLSQTAQGAHVAPKKNGVALKRRASGALGPFIYSILALQNSKAKMVLKEKTV